MKQNTTTDSEATHLSEARQKSFWNRWNRDARSPLSINAWTRHRADAILAALRSLSLVQPKILDFGCGTGWFTEELAAFGPTTGVDLADEVIAEARARSPHIAFVAGDVYAIPAHEETFDVVVSQDVVAHVPDQRRYIDRAAALLKPAGFLIITSTNKFVVKRLGLPPQPAEHLENWLYMRDLLKLLKPSFRILSRRTVTPLGHRGILRLVNAPRLNRLASSMSSPEAVTALKERIGLGYSMLVLAQKHHGHGDAH